MSSFFQDLQEKLSNLVGSWASYAALGTFLLYLFGYLSLRFHLTALGIPTDLTVVDQRYFYAGAKFLVYVLLYIPVIVLIALVVVIMLVVLVSIVAALFALYTRIFKRENGKNKRRQRGVVRQAVVSWSKKAWVIALLGIIVSEVWIQFLMKQCFSIHDALLDPSTTEMSWVAAIMRNQDNNYLEVIFFCTVVAGTIVVAWLLFTAINLRKKAKNTAATLLIALLAGLFTIQVLLLPVNHGVLIADKVLPRVTDLGGQEKLQEKQTAWLVWEGNEGVTYLVQSEGSWDYSTQNWSRVRKLITLPKKNVTRTEVVANDSISKLLNEQVAVVP